MPNNMSNMVKTVKTKKMKKNIFAIFDAPLSIPLKPSIPAIKEMTKNTKA